MELVTTTQGDTEREGSRKCSTIIGYNNFKGQQANVELGKNNRNLLLQSLAKSGDGGTNDRAAAPMIEQQHLAATQPRFLNAEANLTSEKKN